MQTKHQETGLRSVPLLGFQDVVGDIGESLFADLPRRSALIFTVVRIDRSASFTSNLRTIVITAMAVWGKQLKCCCNCLRILAYSPCTIPFILKLLQPSRDLD